MSVFLCSRCGELRLNGLRHCQCGSSDWRLATPRAREVTLGIRGGVWRRDYYGMPIPPATRDALYRFNLTSIAITHLRPANYNSQEPQPTPTDEPIENEE